MRRLSDVTLGGLAPDIERPAYERAAVRTGVVHFGPGAFHRAHQAHFFDRMLGDRPDFGVCAVSLRSGDVAEALAPQDGLYTLVELDAEPRLRIIGALQVVLDARRDGERVMNALADPQVRLVTATVTEKGYCLTACGDLDLAHPDIRHDLADLDAPRSFIGWLLGGLARRRAAGAGGLAALSCDNLADNGPRLRRAVLQLARARGQAELARWIAGEVRFPATMVDSITPATDAGLRALVDERLGAHDAWPVQREPFAQWVIEDTVGADAAALSEAGATITGEVAPFERAKLRLLNGAHSTLAYVGLALGRATVAEAMADEALAAFVERMMRQDIAPTLAATRGLDLDRYVTDVLTRFRNPGVVHKLTQIAGDGSQKLPFRLLGTVFDALAAGRPVDRLALAVGAWMHFVRTRAQAGEPITDPLADVLASVGQACRGEAADVARFLDVDAIFPRGLAADERFRSAVADAYLRFAVGEARAALNG